VSEEAVSERFIDISESGAVVRCKNRCLVIINGGNEVASVPFREISSVVVSSPRALLSARMMAELCLAGGVLVIGDTRQHPVAMMLPLVGHSTQVERMGHQLAASKPTRKRVWRQVVRAKIRNQASVLKALGHDAEILLRLLPLVRSGDLGNQEAHAASLYWDRVFPKEFRRDRHAADQNRFLNYGYGVLRAMVARATCAAGLHPSVGIQHHNRYNGYVLVDDLMEPYRPIVDTAVLRLLRNCEATAPLTPLLKKELLQVVLGRWLINGEERTTWDLVQRSVRSLIGVFMERRRSVWYPAIDFAQVQSAK